MHISTVLVQYILQAVNGELVARYETAKSKLDDVEAKIAEKKSRRASMEKFLSDLVAQKEIMTEFDGEAWTALVDFITVGKDGTVAIMFNNGIEVEVETPLEK